MGTFSGIWPKAISVLSIKTKSASKAYKNELDQSWCESLN